MFKKDKNIDNIVWVFFRIPLSPLHSLNLRDSRNSGYIMSLITIRNKVSAKIEYKLTLLIRWKRRDVEIMQVLRKRQANDSTLFDFTRIEFESDFFGRNHVSLHIAYIYLKYRNFFGSFLQNSSLLLIITFF